MINFCWLIIPLYLSDAPDADSGQYHLPDLNEKSKIKLMNIFPYQFDILLNNRNRQARER